MSAALDQFAEKYVLARQAAGEANPQGGLCGVELEWNLLDTQLRPLLTVGAGPAEQSFVDYLRSEALPDWLLPYSQLEVFHWMIEWATRPFYSPRGAVYEGRLMEAALINALAKAGRQFGDQLVHWPGNLPVLTEVSPASIPASWHIAKRRYLERCVALYGPSLATAGTHTNLSLPEPLLAWDFMHLPASQRGDMHLDEYKSEFYITAARLMRAFAALFIALGAATPLQAQERDSRPVVVLTDCDSVRSLTFPNPAPLDVPDLYRSYADYLRISYDLVRRGVRFGNNNWTPVRARSFAEPVERLIEVTSAQLHALYARGLYAAGRPSTAGDLAAQIEVQNLLARVNLPMARLEVRTDDGGHTLDEDVALLALKHVLLGRFYADPQFGRAFRYDAEDIARARRNEELAARAGLRAEIENPFTGKPVLLSDFLAWTLAEIGPWAQALGYAEDLRPLEALAAGAPTAAGRMRQELQAELGGSDEVPLELLRRLAEQRQDQARAEVGWIAAHLPAEPADAVRLRDWLRRFRQEAHCEPQAPISFRPPLDDLAAPAQPDKTGEVLALAQALIRIPSVTTGPAERLDEVRRAATLIYDYARQAGLEARYFDQEKYPALWLTFPGRPAPAVALSGHFDVVPPEPDDRQFEPRIEGDYLWGRGAADMKTVVATYLVWMKDVLKRGGPFPPVGLLLVGNEENGETEPAGTPHVLRALAAEQAGYAPALLIAGERTGERGDELWGEVCIENRGVMRFEITAAGMRAHSGAGAAPADLAGRLFQARLDLEGLFAAHLTLHGAGGWQSQARFPYVQVGEAGVFNITPSLGRLGVEVRSIPQDRLEPLRQELEGYCQAHDLGLAVSVMENGVAADSANPHLQALLRAIRDASGAEARVGKKLAGTSARFAPAGQGVVWGQSGLDPHGAGERHFIPSILPYDQALEAYARLLLLLPKKAEAV